MVNVEPDKLTNIKKGRPPRYNLAKAKQIANQVKRGLPLRYAAPLCGIPWNTAREWVREHFPEFPQMLEEAHSEWVRSHVGNIERLSGNSEKASQWLLERRAKEEFAPAYVAPATQNTLNVAVLGGEALGKLMQGWSGMIGQNQSQQSQIIDITEPAEQNPNTEPSPSLLVHNSAQLSEPPKPEAIPLSSEEISQPEQKEASVKSLQVVKRKRGRPRKYPKPDATGIPPPCPTPNL